MFAGGKELQLQSISEMRGQVFAVTQVDLAGNKLVDDGLANLAGLRRLDALQLSRTALTNEGLKNLANLNSLRVLGIVETKVTDDGLLHLKV